MPPASDSESLVCLQVSEQLIIADRVFSLFRNTGLLHYKYLAGRELRALEEVPVAQAANRARQSKPSCTRANTR